MGILLPETMYLFSGLKGTLTYHGKPAENIKIALVIIDPNNVKSVDYFYTNEQGEFDIPPVTKKVRTGFFQELVIISEIFAYVDEQEFVFWSASKRYPQQWAELGGEPIGVTCEITEEIIPLSHPLYVGAIGTMCKWQNFKEAEALKSERSERFKGFFVPKEY